MAVPAILGIGRAVMNNKKVLDTLAKTFGYGKKGKGKSNKFDDARRNATDAKFEPVQPAGIPNVRGTGAPKVRKTGIAQKAGAVGVLGGAAANMPNLEEKPKQSFSTRTIKAGDTLSQLAKDNNTTINALMKLNPQITNADRLYKGQKIKITKGTEANPYKGYTFPKAKNPPKSKPQQTVQEKIEELNKKKVGKPGYNRRNSTSKKYGGKMVKKKEGGSVGSKSKSSKSKSSKPKGVGCATRGYGKAMGGK